MYLPQKNGKVNNIFSLFEKRPFWDTIVYRSTAQEDLTSFCKLCVMEPRQSSEILMVDIKNQCLGLAIKTRTMFNNTTKHQQAFSEMLLLEWGRKSE